MLHDVSFCVCALEYTFEIVNLLMLLDVQFKEECRNLYTAVAQRWKVLHDVSFCVCALEWFF